MKYALNYLNENAEEEEENPVSSSASPSASSDRSLAKFNLKYPSLSLPFSPFSSSSFRLSFSSTFILCSSLLLLSLSSPPSISSAISFCPPSTRSAIEELTLAVNARSLDGLELDDRFAQGYAYKLLGTSNLLLLLFTPLLLFHRSGFFESSEWEGIHE